MLQRADFEQGAAFYAPQIDCLRFTAAMLVLVHHAPRLPGMAALQDLGWIGVDLFLCISAFLLTRLLRIEQARTGNIQLRAFFIRRALRIWPLYFGYAAVMSVAAVVVFQTSPATAAGWMLSHLSFSANVLSAIQGFSPIPFTAHLWTIPLEEQAYFVIALALLALGRRDLPDRWIIAAAIGAMIVLALGRMGSWLTGVTAQQIMVLPFRADGVILGVVAALLAERDRLPGKIACFWLAGGSFAALLVVGAAGLLGEGVYLAANALLSMTCLFALLAALQTRLCWRPLVFLGKISFGIYIFHPLALRASQVGLERLGMAQPLAVLLLALALVIAVAALSYHVYERPFLKLKRRFTVVPSRPV